MVSEGVLCSKNRSWLKKSSQGSGAHRDRIEELGGRCQLGRREKKSVRGRDGYLLGFSNRFLLGVGTIVPVEDVEEAEDEESLGDEGRMSGSS